MKKRCSHTFDNVDNDPEAEAGSSTKNGHPASNPTAFQTPYSHQNTGTQGNSAHYGYPKSAVQPRSPTEESHPPTPPNFLGYLNPEAVLREQVHPIHERGKLGHSPILPPIGQYIDGHDGRSPIIQTGPTPARLDETSPQTNLTQEASIQRALQVYLDAVGVSIVPPRTNQDALVQIYFTYVHPLLPIVDMNLFLKWYAEGTAPQILLQAICIVASKHKEAEDHLLLGDDPHKMGPRDFSQRLYHAVIANIEAKLEKNRVILIQVLALISLHCEGPDGAEQASMHLAQAVRYPCLQGCLSSSLTKLKIHHAHTFGLQFGHQWKNQKSDSQENLEDLFWCLWSLDKINACMNGRPLIMHDQDNSLTRLPEDPEKRSSPFGVWLQIAEMLDKVIDYYRPGRAAEETGWEDDFLGFEEMVGDGEDKLEGPIMSKSTHGHILSYRTLMRPTGLLSLFHHAMCMASHKSLSINDPVKSTPSYVRQSLSATRVLYLLNAESPAYLPPLPIVPYALSLALSVVYRHFRSRRLKVHINRAKEELRQCVELLKGLSNAWWSAETMAKLGEAVLNNADRNTRTANTPSTVTDVSQTRQHQDAVPEPPTQQPHHQTPTVHTHWETLDSSIDPRLQNPAPTPNMTHLLNPMPTPGQHPTSSERIDRVPMAPPPGATYDFSENWDNIDTAFENFEALLGSSGADFSNELYRPLHYEGVW